MAPPRIIVPKTRNNGTLTEAAFFGLLRSILRRGFKNAWLPMQGIRLLARRPSQSSNKRLKWEYQCNECKEWFPEKLTHIDHVIPCGSLRCWEDVVPFIQKLTAEGEGAYQLLCISCNTKKATAEKLERKQNRNNNGDI